MKLFELDPNNPVDAELARTANGATKKGSMDPNDIDSMSDEPGMENEPDPSMMDQPEEPESSVNPDKPVDMEMLGMLQSHPYVTNYDHSDTTARSNPVALSQMDVDELRQTRNRARALVAQNTFNDRVGMYDNPEVQAAQDMLSFVDKILSRKELAVKSREKKAGNKPKVRQQQPSKTQPGDQRKPKRG